MMTLAQKTRIRVLRAAIRHLWSLVEIQLNRNGPLDRTCAAGNIAAANRALAELKLLQGDDDHGDGHGSNEPE